MSWKFAGVYIKPGFENPEETLHFLGINKRYTYEMINFSAVVNSSFEATAIGFVNGVSLVHDNTLPYNNSYEADTFTDADFNMIELSKKAEIVSFFLDGITESYGYNHFKDGQRIRRYAEMGGELILEEGDFTKSKKIKGELKILYLLEQFTSLGINELLKNDDLEMYCFTETGF